VGRHEPRTGRGGGEVAEGGAGLEHVLLGRTNRLDLEEVIHHADEVEPALVGGARDLPKRRTDLFRAARPREERDLEADLHSGAAFRNRRVVHVSSIFANPTGRYPFSPVISPSTSRCFHHGVAGRSVTALALPPLGSATQRMPSRFAARIARRPTRRSAAAA